MSVALRAAGLLRVRHCGCAITLSTNAGPVGPGSRSCEPQRSGTRHHFQFLELHVLFAGMIVIGTGVVESYLADHRGHKGIKAAKSQYQAWLEIVTRANWRNPENVKASYPKASILKANRVVFNIKGNDYRLVAALQYRAGVLVIRFFGSHAEYDEIDAEIV
jgi:mRNA interferase HigB